MVYVAMFPRGRSGGRKETSMVEDVRVVRVGEKTPSGAAKHDSLVNSYWDGSTSFSRPLNR